MIKCDRDGGVFVFAGHIQVMGLVGAVCPNCGRKVVIQEQVWLKQLLPHPDEKKKE